MSFNIDTDGRAVMDANSEELDAFMLKGFKIRSQVFGNVLECYSPTSYPYKIPDHKQKGAHRFISISVTGMACSLMCDHCEGRLLKGMEPALDPETLLQKCTEVKKKGGEGVLISGGSDAQGHVPLARFGKAIQTIKKDLGLEVIVHTGLVDEKTASILGDANIDAAMIDIIGDSDVAKDVYHIEDGPTKMARSLDLLIEQGIPIAPHVLVGLNYGKLGGELEALDMISQRNPDAVVIISLNPIRKTAMEHAKPPTPESVGRVMTVARLAMPKTPLLLGCARPMGVHKIESDKYAIRCGANGVAYISQEGVDLAREMNLNPVFSDVCCSLAYKIIKKA